MSLHLPAVSQTQYSERGETVDAWSKGKPPVAHHAFLLPSHPFLQQIL